MTKKAFTARAATLLALALLSCNQQVDEVPPHLSTQKKKLDVKTLVAMGAQCDSDLKPQLIVAPAEDVPENAPEDAPAPTVKFEGKELNCGEAYELVISEPDGDSTSESLVADMTGSVESAHPFDGQSGERQATLYDSNGDQVAQILSHNNVFRYSHLTWRPVGARTAEFSVVSGFNRVYPGSGPDGYVVTGDTFQENNGTTTLCFGDGTCTGTLTYQVTSHDVAQGWVIARAITPSQPQRLPGTGVLVTETEPNNSISSANTMRLGDDYFSNISTSGESDYVRFTLAQRKRVEIRTSLVSMPDSYLYLYNSAGSLLASDDDSGGGLTSLITITLDAGTYYIRAAGYSSRTGTQYVQLREIGTAPAGPITRAYTSDGPFTAYIHGCCRPGSLANYNTNYMVRSVVRFSPANSSPVSTLSPVIDAPANNTGFSFQVPATDAEGDQLTFRLATSTESYIYTAPPGMTVSSTGLVRWSTAGTLVGQLWAAQVVIEERRNGVLIGSSAVDFLLRITQGTNRPPVANAGPDQSVSPGATVRLNGAGSSDPDGHAITYNWSITSSTGPAVVLSSPTSASPSFTTSGEGTYTFLLTVTDSQGASASDTVVVRVGNLPPVVNAGPDQTVNEGATVTLTGSASDPEGSALTYRWTITGTDGAPPVPLSSPTSTTTRFTPTDNGTYIVALTATDSQGAMGTDTVTVRVQNVAPRVTATGGELNEGEAFTSSGSYSDPGEDTFTATVDYGDGTGVRPLTLNYGTFTLSHFYANSAPGDSFFARIVITDDDGGQGTFEVPVVVHNVAPTFVSVPGSVVALEGQPINAALSFADPGEETWEAWVDYGDGTSESLPLASRYFTLQKMYLPGNYLVRVTLRDSDGASATTEFPVEVRNVAPTVYLTGYTAEEGQWSFGYGGFEDPSWMSGDYTITADFGDGTGVHEVERAGNEFWLYHFYLDSGTYQVTVTVTDSHGGVGTATVPFVVENVAPEVNAYAIYGAEGSNEAGIQGWLHDPGQADTWTATVDYGDGTPVETHELTSNQFELHHTYADDGGYLALITITDDEGASTPHYVWISVYNVEPQLMGLPQFVELNEGSMFRASGSFTDPGADTWQAWVDYGDGAGLEPLPLNGKSFALEHFYADGNWGWREVAVMIQDSDGGWDWEYFPVYVNNVAPEITLPQYGESIEGSMFQASGSFTDPGADVWEAWVGYGDGTWEQLALNGKTFELNHVYADSGTYYVDLYLSDDDGGWSHAYMLVNVHNVAPEVTVTGGEADEGSEFVTSISFTDPGDEQEQWLGDGYGRWWAEVDFGDGSGVHSIEPEGKDFTLSHQYPDNGVYTVTVRIFDGEDWGTATSQVTVHNVAPQVIAHWDFSEIDEGTSFAPGFSVVDPGWADSWVAQVDYGDGSPVQTIYPSPWGGNGFQLDHRYADDGVYQLTITVQDDDGAFGTFAQPVQVLNVAPYMYFSVLSGGMPEGSVVTGAGAFFDVPADTHTLTVNYGDGSAPEQIPLAPGTSLFNLAHVYEDNGLYQITVTLTDDDGGAATSTVTAWVFNVAPTVTASNDSPQYWGLPVNLVGTATDPSAADTRAGFSSLWSLGDGTTASGLTTAHVYTAPGTYGAQLTVTDKDGGFNQLPAATAVTIQKRPGAVTCQDMTAVFGFPAVLSARFVDGLAGALPGGRSLSFHVGGSTNLGSFITDASGLASVQSPGELAPGSYPITVSFTEDSLYTAAQASCTLTVTRSNGAITGGAMRFANRARGGFNVRFAEGGSVGGELQFQSDTTSFHASVMTALGLSANKRQGWFAGTGHDGRAFTAYLEDNGEPGSSDVFKLWIDGTLQTGDGALSGGNIQIH
jgi:PKD repeat protein